MRNIGNFPELRGLVKRGYLLRQRMIQRKITTHPIPYPTFNRPTRVIQRVPRFRTRRTISRTHLTGIEMHHLKNLRTKYGIEAGHFDFHAHIDRRLTYAENKTQLESKLKVIGRPVIETDVQAMNAEFDKHLDTLKWRADSGDIRARQELAFRLRRR